MSRKTCAVVVAWVAAATLLTVVAEPVHAELYKSIDKDGRVTYSSKPVPDAVAITVIKNPPAPSAEDVRAAEEATRRIAALADEMEKDRLQREEQRARLDTEKRMWEAYVQQSQASVLGSELPWIIAVETDAHRMHFHLLPQRHSGSGHRRFTQMHVGMAGNK